MAKKDKIVIQRDKTLEPIDNELDEAMGLLEAANRQITDLLTSLEGGPVTELATGAAELDDAGAEIPARSDAPATTASEPSETAQTEPEPSKEA